MMEKTRGSKSRKNQKSRGFNHCLKMMKEVEVFISCYRQHTPIKIKKDIEKEKFRVKEEQEIMDEEDT